MSRFDDADFDMGLCGKAAPPKPASNVLQFPDTRRVGKSTFVPRMDQQRAETSPALVDDACTCRACEPNAIPLPSLDVH